MTTLTHIADIERELGVTLIGAESEKKDFDETANMSGDDVFYKTIPFTRTTFNATGFRLHQNGGVISGSFPDPIEVVAVETNEYGHVLSASFDEAVIARAVLAKLGGIPDMEGGLRAAAGAEDEGPSRYIGTKTFACSRSNE